MVVNSNTLFSKILAISLLPLFFVSCVFSNLFTDAYFTGKELYFYAAAILPVLVSLFYIIKRKFVFELNLNATDILLLIYLAYETIRLAFTPERNFTDTFYLMHILGGIIYIFFRIIFSDKDSRAGQTILVVAALAAAFVQMGYGLLQFLDVAKSYSPYFTIIGSFGNPSPLSNYLVAILPLAFSAILFLRKKDKNNKILHAFSAILVVGILFLLLPMKARTAWVGAAAVLLILFYFKIRNTAGFKKISQTPFKKMVLLLCLVFVVIVGAIKLISFKEDSAKGRLLTYKISAQIVSDAPVIGKGFNTFPAQHAEYQYKYFKKGGSTKEIYLAENLKNAFNEYLETATELGLLGVFLFLLFALSPFFNRKGKEMENSTWEKGAFAGLIAILVMSLFSYPLHHYSIWIQFLLYAAILGSQSKTVISISQGKTTGILYCIISIVIIVCFSIYYPTYFSAQLKWQKAATYAQKQNALGFKIYEEIYPVLKHNEHFIYNYGGELSKSGDFAKSLEILKQAKATLNDADLHIFIGNCYEIAGELEKAEKSFEKAMYMVPHKIYPKYRLAIVYFSQRRNTEGFALAKKIVEFKPKVNSDATATMKQEMKAVLDKYNK